MPALIALAARVGTMLGRPILGGAGRRALLGGAAGGLAIPALGGLVGDGEAFPPRRRRRRKALTDADIRTALTIASAISKKAAENFILTRTRSQ